jgi:hypothetical protein
VNSEKRTVDSDAGVVFVTLGNQFANTVVPFEQFFYAAVGKWIRTSPPLRAWPHCFHYGEHGLTLSN